MKKILLAFSLFVSFGLSAQVIYDADFSVDGAGFPDHMTGSVPASAPQTASGGTAPDAWVASYTSTPGTDGTANEFSVNSGVLRIQDWGGTAKWISQDIDVSTVNEVSISALATTVGGDVQSAASEFFEYFYILDAGSEVATDVPLDGSDTDGTPVNYSITTLDVSGATTLKVGFNFRVDGAGDGYEISEFVVTDLVTAPIVFNSELDFSELTQEFGYAVNPTYTTGELTISYNQATFENYTFSVVSPLGGVIANYPVTPNTLGQTIDVSQLPTGMYFLQLEDTAVPFVKH